MSAIFGHGCPKKGATEPGWRICTGCVTMKRIVGKISKSSFPEQRAKNNVVVQNDMALENQALLPPES